MSKYWQLAVCFVFLLCGCRDERVSLVNRRNYRDWIRRLEIGYAYDNLPVTSRVILGDLRAYLEKHKDRIYGGDEVRYEFHQGLMHLYGAQFFLAFHTLREYTRVTGDLVGPYYHIGRILYRQFDYTGVDVLFLCAIAQTFPNQTRLVQGQQRALLSSLYIFGYPFAKVGEGILTNEVKETEQYENAYRVYSASVQNVNNLEDCIEKRICFEVFTKDYVTALEGKTNLSVEEVDFLVQYYIHPYYADYEKAVLFADKRKDPINRGDISTYTIITNMMKAYLSMDRFDDAIDVFKRNQNQVSVERRKLKESQHHINLYLSAAYAGKREFEKSLEYLDRELSITEIHKSWLRTDSPKTLADLVTNGDMLYSLFAVVFLLDEFEEFEKASRYSEIEELVERHVSRYKHLPVFNRN